MAEEPREAFAIPVLESLNIDGDLSDWKEPGFQVNVLGPRDGVLQAPEDFAPRLRLGWNEEGLLIAADVHDDLPAERPGEKAWEGDSIEVFLAAGANMDQKFQLVVNPGIDGRAELKTLFLDRRKDKALPLHAQAAAKKTEHGYSMEILIPWEPLGLSPKEGVEFFCQLQANDRDSEGGKRRELSWFPHGWAGKGTDYMYSIRLSDQADPPVQAAIISKPGGSFRTQNFLAIAVPDLAGETFSVIGDRGWKGEKNLELREGWATATLEMPLPDKPSSGEAMTNQASAKVTGEHSQRFSINDYRENRLKAVQEARLRGGMIFHEGAFPEIEFETPGWVESLLGPYQITTTFYDADYEEVEVPSKPGRYGAILRVESETLEPIFRYVTLYKSAEAFDLENYEADTLTWPADSGISSEARTQHEEAIRKDLQYLLNDSLRNHPSAAGIAAGFHEAEGESEPITSWNGTRSRDRNWWFGLKKKLGLYKARYAVYYPEDYEQEKSSAKKWPTIIILHGSGERGTDLELAQTVGLAKLPKSGKKFPFLMIAPQCDPGENWLSAKVIDLVDEVSEIFPVDPDRIYLTGNSMGGYGTFYAAAAYPDRFAAIAPVCGGGDAEAAERLINTPTWMFHGDADTAVKVEESQKMADAIRAAGGEHVKLTIYPGVKHNSWDAAYADERLYRWFLANRLGQEPVKPEPDPAPAPNP